MFENKERQLLSSWPPGRNVLFYNDVSSEVGCPIWQDILPQHSVVKM